MAITQCSECGGNVSTMAEACPHCGTTDALDDALEWKHATPNRRLPELRELGWVAMKEAEPVTQRSNLWTQYTSLQGRISRKTFWLWFFVPIAVLSMLSTLLDLSLGTYVSGAGFGPAWLPGQASGPVSFTMTLLTLWPFTVGWVKRLHDRDITGKHVVALYGSYVLVYGLGMEWDGKGPVTFAVLPMFALLVYFIYLVIIGGFLRGTDGPNRYGPDPLQGSAGD